MKEQVEKLIAELDVLKIETSEALEQFRLAYLTKKGLLNDLFDQFKTIPNDLKKEMGQKLNLLKQKAQSVYDQNKERFENTAEGVDDEIDFSLPGRNVSQGARHPLTIVQNQMVSIFEKMGFDISEGPEIEDDWHNFSALNFPENHPARDMQDTFFIDNGISLRTHTSSVQVRAMESRTPPIRTISPGRVYRNEAISARSNSFFHQIEGLYIDEGVSFADLKQTLFLFVQQFFGENTKVRFRPSYFPFTEPSAEMDIYLGTATPEDYRLTKGTGWLEILGCGMVDVNVLENCGIDSKKYSGFAFGMGVERITMFRYGVKDLRTFFENDIRFLSQFKSVD
ncbi:MAG: phenylalanine--tRNA ligase subunit alpha [Flavobacteriales bacterium]|nr:phenylalanine--tRNA ligase subunit alpha [Flavobacteriales bacterium]